MCPQAFADLFIAYQPFSDHPNASHKKRQTEERGPFGKSSWRKGSSRATRTQTPAKKENTALDGFDAALKYDAHMDPLEQSEQSAILSKASSDGSAVYQQQSLSLAKEPTQVILMGYSPNTQWAAISFYENVSGGIICEDYDREPPSERRRYHRNLGTEGYVHARALTNAEKALAYQYSGGRCWIKVTFESPEAAERAMYHSPHIIQGHWVYVEPYRGQGPKVDEPVMVKEEDHQQGLLGVPKPMPTQTQSLGPSFSMQGLSCAGKPLRANATLPRSFITKDNIDVEPPNMTEDTSMSSSTASSATATGPEYPSLSQRSTSHYDDAQALAGTQGNIEPSLRPTTFKHFPETPRTVLRPANEAFLPQRSWWDTFFKHLTQQGWIPRDFIGNSIPRLENGDFDWSSASLYWRFFYWIDTHLGTDWCGMKES